MARTTGMFVHILLFECPNSGDPIATQLIARDANLEIVDASNFDLTCACNWTGRQLGIRARRHWVEPWSRGNSAD